MDKNLLPPSPETNVKAYLATIHPVTFVFFRCLSRSSYDRMSPLPWERIKTLSVKVIHVYLKTTKVLQFGFLKVQNGVLKKWKNILDVEWPLEKFYCKRTAGWIEWKSYQTLAWVCLLLRTGWCNPSQLDVCTSVHVSDHATAEKKFQHT